VHRSHTRLWSGTGRTTWVQHLFIIWNSMMAHKTPINIPWP
jgi:hypothetical protein